jgi:hypothetical protein
MEDAPFLVETGPKEGFPTRILIKMGKGLVPFPMMVD